LWGRRQTGRRGWAGGSRRLSAARLGVHEQAIAKRHSYPHLTVMPALQQSRLLYLADDRTQERLDGFRTLMR
jgi:hypothetical protein